MKGIQKLEILLNLIPVYESTKTSDVHPAVSQLIGTRFQESLLRRSPVRSCAEREWEVIRLAGSSFVCRMFLFKYSFKKSRLNFVGSPARYACEEAAKLSNICHL